MSIAGAYDMAGNVREWTSTAIGSDRFASGNAWNDAVYDYFEAIGRSPWERVPQNGFRCARYLSEEGLGALQEPVAPPRIDLERARAFEFSDDTWSMIVDLLGYDATPFNAQVERVEEGRFGTRTEWVSIDAAYAGERILMRMHFPPARFSPPHQAVVYLPGGLALGLDSIAENRQESRELDFVHETGRVLIEVALAGTFERRKPGEQVLSPRDFQALFQNWVKDLGRTIDYLEERSDIRGDSVAAIGLSLGAAVSPIMVSVEGRFQAVVSWAGCLIAADQDSMNQALAYAKRATAPFLMINGRYDAGCRLEERQKPLFEAWGAAESDKRHVVYDAGHYNDFPRRDFAREITDWLDRYLGPVEARHASSTLDPDQD
jgi:dienelactone hydrolase